MVLLKIFRIVFPIKKPPNSLGGFGFSGLADLAVVDLGP